MVNQAHQVAQKLSVAVHLVKETMAKQKYIHDIVNAYDDEEL
jgi:hypothetical protein